MRRDTELARAILLAVEAMPNPNTGFVVDGEYTADTLEHHIELLKESGLLLVSHAGGTLRQPQRAITLTWRGCEFLDLVRSEDVWQYVRTRSRGGELPFELLEALAFQYVSQKLGLRASTGATGEVVDGSVTSHKGA